MRLSAHCGLRQSFTGVLASPTWLLSTRACLDWGYREYDALALRRTEERVPQMEVPMAPNRNAIVTSTEWAHI